MYRVNLRDGEFMKVQSKLQVKNGRKTNIDPQGEFNYNKHHDLVKKLNKTPFAYTERKMNHFMPTSGELAAAELATQTIKREKARNEMLAKFEAENPPMSDYDKQ